MSNTIKPSGFGRKLAGAAILLLAGCSAPPQETPTGVTVTNGGGVAEIQDIVTKAGVRCVSIVGYYKAGISCDWQHAPESRP